jgi:hypothetical protein
MTVAIQNIIPAKQAENAQTAQYTSDGAKTIIDKFTATNTSASNADLSVNLVPSSGSASSANLVVQTRTLAPGETYTCPELVGQVLEDGGFISTLASVASAITIRASGRIVT